MRKRTQGFLIGTGAAAVGGAVWGVLSRLKTKILVSTALDREIPRSMKNRRMTKNRDDEKIRQMLKECSVKLENCGCETVETTGQDSAKLIGHYYKNPDEKRVIIAMHGWRSSWSNDFGAIADFWHNNGCSVLYAEQRGQNNSGGDYMGFGMLERYDCLAWINYIIEKNQNDTPIYLAGISMGAATVLMTSGFTLPSRIHGIMADCGFTSANAIWRHVAENTMNVSFRMRKRAVDELCRKKIQVSSNDYSTVDALMENEIPVLFIHGTDDDFVPVEMTFENYKASIAPKRLFIVPGANHAMSYIVDKNGYEDVVINFWKDFD